jgi:transcription antitermination factor NusG
MSAVITGISGLTCSGSLELPEEYCEPRWYAAYTRANHEKRVSEQFGACRIEHFLPLYSSVRRWKDRRVTLEMPLFPGYVFVRIALQDRLRVLKIPGVARLVGFNGTPAALPSDEIESLRASLVEGVKVRPHRYLVAGQRVSLRSGPLVGLTGTLVRQKGRTRLVISVDLIQRSVAVELDEADLFGEP